MRDPTQKIPKIMPLGDSITLGVGEPTGHSFGGYRLPLWKLLQSAGHSFDFVGSARCGPPALLDKDHEGHPGWTIAQLHEILPHTLPKFRPDLILLVIGTNDLFQGLPEPEVRLAGLLQHIHFLLPEGTIFLGTVPPLTLSLEMRARSKSFNLAVDRLVDQHAAHSDRIRLVNFRTAMTESDLYDGVHPNNAGYEKMAGIWYRALQPFFTGGPRSGD